MSNERLNHAKKFAHVKAEVNYVSYPRLPRCLTTFNIPLFAYHPNYPDLGRRALIPSMIRVFVDGACRSNGQSDPIAAIGVHFEQYPEDNLSKVLRIPQPTNQKAELIAAIRGLEKSFVIANSLGTEVALGGRSSRGEHIVHLVADSEYVVKGIREWIPKWKQNGYRTSKDKPVVNATLFKHLEDLVYKAFPEMGWSVEAVHVPRNQNQRADALANSALNEKMKSGMGEPLHATWISSNMPSQHMCHQR